MEQLELEAQMREITGKKVSQLRRAGMVPAILYGHNINPMPLQVSARSLLRILRQGGGNRLINLRVDGQVRTVLAKEVQRDPISQALLHADFQEVVMTEKITAEVPIEFVGQSPAVASGLAMLIYGLDQLEIQCLPGDLPPGIPVDLNQLTEPDQAIYVRDLSMGPGIEVLSDPEEMIVKLLRARRPTVEEEEAEEMVEAEMVEPEVLSERRRAERLAQEAESE